MKTLSNIRYFLFAFMVLGLFANLAQNEYGLAIIYHSCFFVGITLLIDAFIAFRKEKKSSKAIAFYLFIENVLLALVFIALDLKSMAQPGANAIIVLCGGSVLLIYFFSAFRNFIKDYKSGKLLSFIMFTINITIVAAIGFGIFKTLHWPGSNILFAISFLFIILQFIIILTKVKFQFRDEKITLGKRILIYPGKLKMGYYYFTITVIHFALITFGIVPPLYNLRVPPALQKMIDESNPKAGKYSENFWNFLDNRNNSK